MTVRIWEGDGNPRTTYQEYLAETQNILTGKVLPGVQCVIFDGMHKFQKVALDAGKATAVFIAFSSIIARNACFLSFLERSKGWISSFHVINP